MVPELELLEFVRSKINLTTKHVYRSRGQIIEVSFINKQDGKDIICMPTQTACRLGCRFCFLSDLKLPVRNLSPEEILASVKLSVVDLGLTSRPGRNRILLISYMGCGEPLLNVDRVIRASEMIRGEYGLEYDLVRFAIASLIPKSELMERLIRLVVQNDLPMKFHLSLHATDETTRHFLMPAAAPIAESIDLTRKFMDTTGNSAEIHYALIEGVNDRDRDIDGLIRLLSGKDIPVKFLQYNKKPTESFRVSGRVSAFRESLAQAGIKTEYYHPPGWDIGSSCGQFLMDHYLKQVRK